ncbi:MAG: hypothetical protein JHC95_03525 [Solirubrobacteraceae bacterium]|nr:hypothetical protein [Solirubrobacteraceae bacterium]
MTAAATATALVALVPAAAQACGKQKLTPSFSSFGDAGLYLPVDNAGFESGKSDWKLRGAGVMAGNEPWKIGGAAHSKSLRLSAGGTAESDEVCVTIDHTHSRFFARSLSATGALRVEVLWDDEGDDHVATVATLSATTYQNAWKPTPTIPMASAVASLYEDEEDELVAFRFVAVGGAWDIDDVSVDPYRAR